MSKLIWNNEKTDEYLKPRNIKRLEEMESVNKIKLWQCIICNCKWATTLSHIKDKETGCPNCFKIRKQKWKNKTIDQDLNDNNRKIKRLEDIKNASTNINWLCEECNHIWATNFNHIKYDNSGCPKCANYLPFDNAYVDQYFLDNNIPIKRMEEIEKGINKSKKWLCMDETCGLIWSTSFNAIKNGGTRCPKCSCRFPINNEDVDQYFIENNIMISRLDDIDGIAKQNKWKCNLCNHIWTTSFNSIKCKDNGCPQCAGNIKITKEEAIQYFIDNNIPIKLVGEFGGAKKNSEWECINNNCHCKWKTTFYHIRKNKSGCPVCNCPGTNEKIVLQVLKVNNINFEYQYKVDNKKNNRPYKIDFYLSNLNLFIEYDGRQHFQPTRFGGCSQESAEENFIKQQARDLYVNQYAIDQGINMLRIDGRTYTKNKLIDFLKDYFRRYHDIPIEEDINYLSLFYIENNNQSNIEVEEEESKETEMETI